MALPQAPSPPHLYPQALQLKLYQAFIFSVPILFSIILLLLFYLFYLKRRRDTNITNSPATLARRLNQQPIQIIHLPFGEGVKEEVIKEKLAIVMFDEDLRDIDTQCCVCLGDFELNEQLHQIPSCKHLFHIDCIHHWLKANYTCPLCRCYIFSTKQLESGVPPVRLDIIIHPNSANSYDHNPEFGPSEQQLMSVVDRTRQNGSTAVEVEASNSRRTCLTEASHSQESADNSADVSTSFALQNSVILQVEMPPS